jgi:hypothetical protein
MASDQGTYTELQSRVNSRVIDLPQQVQAEVPLLVNEALFELQTRHNFKVMEAELYTYTQATNRTLQTGAPTNGQPPLFIWPGQSTTIANQTINVGVAGGFKGFQDGAEPTFVRYQDGSVRFISIAPDRRSIYGQFTEGDSSFPSLILVAPPSVVSNNQSLLEVYPLPDAASDWPDGEYRIQIPYFQYLPYLVNGSDANWLTTNPHGERFIVEWATAEAFALDWDMPHEQEHKQKAELELKWLIKQDKLFRLSPVNELAVHWRGVYQGRSRT